MTIQVKNMFDMAFSYENGMALRESINETLKTEKKVIVDFKDITVFTTMFFNACSGHFVLSNSRKWYDEKIECINLNELGIQTHKHSIENAEKKRDSAMTDKDDKLAQITTQTITDNT